MPWTGDPRLVGVMDAQNIHWISNFSFIIAAFYYSWGNCYLYSLGVSLIWLPLSLQTDVLCQCSMVGEYPHTPCDSLVILFDWCCYYAFVPLSLLSPSLLILFYC
jgi:hypothetical protein